MMKAVVISEPGPPEVLKIQEIADLTLAGRDEVKVSVRAAALNRADLLQRLGKYPAPAGVDPRIPGLEFAGVVQEVGTGVTEWAPGDRVMGLLGGGGYAEQVITSERMLLPVPENLGWEQAAGVPEVFATAFDALFTQLNLAPGETLLIHAVASGVGITALQFAKTTGCRVFGTAGSDEKLKVASDLGLDVAINYRTRDFREVVAAETRNQGVDAILDLVGAPYWASNLASLKTRGRLVIIGLLGGNKAEVNLAEVLTKRLTIRGAALRSRPLEEKIALMQSLRRQVVPLLQSGRVRPVIDRVFPFEQAAQAHAYMQSNASIGKIVLRLTG
jgi:NADPH2:quinone reductase